MVADQYDVPGVVMGGTGLYHPPVKSWTGVSTWTAHTNRSTPSTEPGTDFYCPRFTELHAAASGVVADIGRSITPATGRYITLDLDDGKRCRYLHLEEIHVSLGQRVAWGQVIGKTGATGYGEADWSWNVAGTGGAHVHMTLWEYQIYQFGRYATLDPQDYIQEIDMPLDPQKDYDAFAYMLHRALKWDVRDGDKVGASASNGATIWDRLGGVRDAAAKAQASAAGASEAVKAIRLELTDEQLAKIASEVSIDYVALAKAVNDEASRRLAS